MAKEGTFYFGCILLKLFEGTCAERVSAYDSDAPSFFHIMVSVFSTSRCFTGTLQPDKHHNVLLASRKLWCFVFRTKHYSKFVDYGLCYKFSKIRTPHITTHLKRDLSLDSDPQCVDVMNVDIRLEKSRSNVCYQLIEHFLIDILRVVEPLQGFSNFSP